MRYSNFKEKKLSKMGFGTLRLPLNIEGTEPDYIAIEKMVDIALGGGINYFDTGYSYAKEKAEVALGKALKRHPRNSYYLADKLPTWRCKSPDDVKEIFEDQLKKCDTDYFDFYLIHSIKEKRYEEIAKYKVMEQLKDEVKKGRIIHLGASAHCGPELLRELLETYGEDLEFIQLQLNYMDWEFAEAKELHKIAVEFDKPIMVMEALRGGMLANPISDSAREVLSEITSGTTYPSLGYRFVEGLQNVAVVLSGVSNTGEVKQNIDIFNERPLSAYEKETILKAAKVLARDIMVPCTACDYCSECPQKIKISKIFATYNEAAASGFNRPWMPLSKDYKVFEKNAKDCRKCGLCEAHCPQNIKIIEQLKKDR
ncbi:MAG: aldo/keto reductase [Anaerovoracaceae bacterium]